MPSETIVDLGLRRDVYAVIVPAAGFWRQWRIYYVVGWGDLDRVGRAATFDGAIKKAKRRLAILHADTAAREDEATLAWETLP